MTTYIIIAVVIIALLCIPIVRTIVRWIIFLPVALLAALLYQFLDIPGLIFNWIASQIIPILDLIFNVVDVFVGFFIVTAVAGLICPISKIGRCIAFAVCLLISVYNLIDCHVYDLFPLDARDPGVPTPTIIWWHIVILGISSILGAWSADSVADE